MQEPQENMQENVELPSAELQEAELQSNGAAGSLDARFGELESQLAEAKAAVLYVKAEGENIRRRASDDIDKARKFALEKFSNELLAVKDSLDAAAIGATRSVCTIDGRRSPMISQQS